MSSLCTLVINPDVSGAGVRAAIYSQNILCFVPAVWAIADGTVSDYELESADTHSTTNLVLAFAILICSIFQGGSRKLTNYHAAIVLSLSWMNNTNAFIYFLLYVQHKSQGEGRDRVEPRLSAWGAHIKARAKTIFCLPDGLSLRRLTHARTEAGAPPARQQQRGAGFTVREASKVLFKRVTILLGSLHLTLMAVVGIWLWSSPRSFGSLDSAECATEVVDLTIFGGRVRFGSPILRGLSLAVYSVFLLPGLNLLLPTLPFLVYHCRYHTSRRLPLPAPIPGPPDPEAAENITTRLRRVRPVIVGLAFLLIVNVVFITDIELTLRQNAHLQNGNESEWGFGQILAMLLVFMPLRDLIEAIFRRKQEMQTKLNSALIDAINKRNMEEIDRWVRAGAEVSVEGEKGETALHLACSDKAHTPLVALLMERGADPTHKLNDHTTAYEVGHLAENFEAVQVMVSHESDAGRAVFEKAVREREWRFVQALVDGAGVGMGPFPDGTTALDIVDGSELQAAISSKDWDGIRILVRLGVRISPSPVQVTDGEAALQEAISGEYWDIMRLLALLGIRVDAATSKDHAATLQAAISIEDWNIACLLADLGVLIDPAAPEAKDNTAALQAALSTKDWTIVRLLADLEVHVNPAASKENTAVLQAIIFDEDWDIVRVLVGLGIQADPANFEENAAMLQAAIIDEDWDLVYLFACLGIKADPANFEENAAMLQAAIINEDWEIVHLLACLGIKADPANSEENADTLQAAIFDEDGDVVRLLAGLGIQSDYKSV